MIELHLHLDGSIRPQTALEIAREMGDPSGAYTEAQMTHALRVPENCTDLVEYLARFDVPIRILQSESALERIACELTEELAAEGLTYAEMRMAPQHSVRGGCTQEQIVLAAQRGIRKGMAKCPGIRVGLILCMMRGAPENVRALNMETIEIAKTHLNDVICGVDLAGAESLFPTESFAEEFALVRRLGLPYTIHAGEGAGPESVRAALDMGAMRLGHGVRSIEDPALVRELARRGVVLEVCVKSNAQVRCVPSVQEHPIRALLDAGVKVTINSDNRTVTNTTLAQEIALCRQTFGFTDAEIAAMQGFAWQARFLKDRA